jgi:putative ABC transport system permease protein
VFQIGQPTQNMAYADFEKIKSLATVSWALPIQLGDSFEGFPVLGTSIDFFKHYRTMSGPLTWFQGQSFADPSLNPEGMRQVVLGAEVAQSKKLTLNDSIVLTHGYQSLDAEHADHPFFVVGILQATGTPLDRTTLISLEGFEALHTGWGLGLRPSAFDSPKSTMNSESQVSVVLPTELTAAWVGLKSRTAVFKARKEIEDFASLQTSIPLMAVLPGVALDELWQVVRVVENALIVMGVLVAVCALLGVVAVLLVGLAARRKELAIYRALGARPQSILMLIVWESFLIGVAGISLGVVMTQLVAFIFHDVLLQTYGIKVHMGWPSLAAWGSIGLLLLGALIASLIPAIRAYRMSLSDGLNPPSMG